MNWLERGACAVQILWLGVACGSSEVPAKQLADTEAGIRAAQELGAQQTPEAALHLKIARDGLERARVLSAEGEQDLARTVLKEAELDAELAVLLTKEEASETEALEAKQRADAFKSASKEQAPKD